MPPMKPDACIIDGKLAVFMGADYKFMPLDAAEAFVRKLQELVDEMKRTQQRSARERRIGNDGAAPEGHAA